MTVGGLKVDTFLKERLAQETRAEVASLKSDFLALARDAVGDPEYTVNPNSPKQLADLYFRKLHLVGRGVATDVKNRQRMLAHPRTPEIARRMLHVQNKYATENKFLGTYAEMEIDKDGRVRCEYKQTGVASAPGRLSSASVMWGTGTNLQNQPEP
jgi:DNA polymerase I-like protein with 3'-5' exonuclease and polymerase domains